MTMPKKSASGQGMVSPMRMRGLGDGQAELLGFDDTAELGPDRLLRLGRDQPDAVVERQAGLARRAR